MDYINAFVLLLALWLILHELRLLIEHLTRFIVNHRKKR